MRLTVNGRDWEPSGSTGAEIGRLSDRLTVRTAAGTHTALCVRSGGATYISYLGRTYRVERARRKAAGGSDAGGEARAPMPGQIVEVTCQVGNEVAVGDRLMVIEAMKMQQPIVAAINGRVASVSVSQGDQVSEGDVLAVVEAE